MKKAKLIGLFLFLFFRSNAEWFQTGSANLAPSGILRLDTLLFSLNPFSIYQSNLSGLNWKRVENAPSVNYGELILSNGILIANTNLGIIRSVDSAITLQFANTGFFPLGSVGGNSIIKMPNGKILALNGQQNIFESIDNGQTWSGTSFPNYVGNEFAFDSLNQILISSGNGLKVSYDLGQTWVDSNAVWGTSGAYGIKYCNGHWFCLNSAGGLSAIYSFGNTNNWTLISYPNGVNEVENFLVSGNRLFANSPMGLLEFNFFTGEFFFSLMNGNGQVNLSGLWNQSYFGYITSNPNGRFNPIKTDNLGTSWLPVRGIHGNSINRFSKSDFMAMNGYGGLYLEYGSSNFQYAIKDSINFPVQSLIVNACKIFQNVIFAATNNGLAKSMDGGYTWINFNSGLPIYGAGYKPVNDFEVFGDTIIAGTYSGIYISTNGGISFNPSNSTIPLSVMDLFFHNHKLYCAGWNRILVSSDLGLNWVSFTSVNDFFWRLTACGNTIFFSSRDSVYMADENLGVAQNISGNIQLLINGGMPISIACIDSLFFVSSMRSGVQKMNINNIGVYNNISENLPVLNPLSNPEYNYIFPGDLIIHQGRLWLGTSGFGCFIKPLSDFGYPSPEPENIKETDYESNAHLEIHPNPANTIINIFFSDGFTGIIRIIDENGAECFSSTAFFPSKSLSFEISHFANGIYFVLCNGTNGKHYSGKFIKK